MKSFLIVFVIACGGNGSAMPDSNGNGDDMQGAAIDGSSDAPAAVVCGSTVCRADQTCVAQECTFPCSGSTVPGDYASIQTAIDALAATGNDATICLGEGTFSEGGSVVIRDTGAHGKALRIVGLSSSRSLISAQMFLQAGWSEVTLEGVEVRAPTTYTAIDAFAPGTSLTVRASKLGGGSGLHLYHQLDVLIDGVEIVAEESGEGVLAYATTSGPLNVRVVNSYLHGGTAVSTLGNGQVVALELVNNTIKDSYVGADMTQSTTALIANNMFTGMTDRALSWTSSVTVTRHHNALWANAANYSGLASDGPSTLKVDCLLGSQAIPQLAAASPCRDVADPVAGTTLDYYGIPRGAAPDLGAVEAP